MPRGIYKRTRKHILPLIRRNKSPENIAKVKKANTGVNFTAERKHNLCLNHADFNGNKNPNWRGGIGSKPKHLSHRFMNKYYKKTGICEHCGIMNTTDWAKRTGMEYECLRENFIELCKKCHYQYDIKIHRQKHTKRKEKHATQCP